MAANRDAATKLEQCILDLHEFGVVKFGSFKLKSGMQSPVYFDLRIVTSFPRLMRTVSELLWACSPTKKFDHVCGVAYTGIPLATVISQQEDLPMIVRRKEAKSYGTKRMVEGVYSSGDTCLIVEDVLVTGTSVYETVQTLLDLDLKVTEAVVFLDREHGGIASLTKLGVNITPVLSMSTMLAILQCHGRVTAAVAEEVAEFVANNSNTSIITSGQSDATSAASEGPSQRGRLSMPYSERAQLTDHVVARRLFATMDSKRSNLCVAADVDSAQDLLVLAKEVGPHICALKTHVDCLPDFTPAVALQLQTLAQEMDFLLFEDRKFVDIGATVCRQYRQQGLWADLVTAAPVLGGDGVVRGLNDAVADGDSKGVVLVAEMSSEGALHSEEYKDACRKMAVDHCYLVVGFVSQSSLSSDPRFVQMTPGVSTSASTDGLGQQYVSPDTAVLQRGADVIIVGRGVTKAQDRAAAARQYQQQGYDAYSSRLLA